MESKLQVYPVLKAVQQWLKYLCLPSLEFVIVMWNMKNGSLKTHPVFKNKKRYLPTGVLQAAEWNNYCDTSWT